MKPVSVFSVLTRDELRALHTQLNLWSNSHSPVKHSNWFEKSPWFELVSEAVMVSQELDRREYVVNPPKPKVLKGGKYHDGDFSGLKRTDLSNAPLPKLFVQLERLAKSLDRQAGNMWGHPEQSQVREYAEICAKQNVSGLEEVLDWCQRAEEKIHRDDSFRLVLNKRISLLTEILKRLKPAA